MDSANVRVIRKDGYCSQEFDPLSRNTLRGRHAERRGGRAAGLRPPRPHRGRRQLRRDRPQGHPGRGHRSGQDRRLHSRRREPAADRRHRRRRLLRPHQPAPGAHDPAPDAEQPGAEGAAGGRAGPGRRRLPRRRQGHRQLPAIRPSPSPPEASAPATSRSSPSRAPTACRSSSRSNRSTKAPCMGSQFDTLANNIGEGWACIAVQSSDSSGNTSVSPPLRVYINYNGTTRASGLVGRPGRAARVHRDLRQEHEHGHARNLHARAGSTPSNTSSRACNCALGRAILRAGMTLPAVASIRCARPSAPPRRSPIFRSRSRRARSTACSAPTARARRRRCGSWSASCGPRAAGAGRRARRRRRPAGGAPAPRLPDQHDRPLPAAHRARAARATSRACTAWTRDAAAARIAALAEALRPRAVSSTAAARRCRPASGSGCRSPAPCCTIRRCWCSTSRPRAWMCWRRASCATSSAPSAIAARRWCSRPTTWPRPSCSAIGSASCIAGGCSPRGRRRAARGRRRRAQPGGSVPALWSARAPEDRSMKLADVLLVAGKELRETLRDRRTLAVMVLFPLVVYPLVSLATVQVLSARIARAEKVPARVAISGPPALADKLRARLAARNHAGQRGLRALDAARQRRRRPRRQDRRRDRDRHPPAGAGAASACACFDETQERSRTARARIEEALAPTAEPGCAAGYAINVEGVAPRTAMGGYLLSKILPLVIIVMVMLGAFHPAIDITAGERERGTLETTLSAPIARAVADDGQGGRRRDAGRAVAACSTSRRCRITVLEGAKLAAAGATMSLPWANAGAAALLVIPPAAFLFASVMVAIGALARSFKEAQTLLTPVYFLCMAPVAAGGARRLPADRRRGVHSRHRRHAARARRDRGARVRGHHRRRVREQRRLRRGRAGARVPALRLRAPARHRRRRPRPARLAPPPRPRPAGGAAGDNADRTRRPTRRATRSRSTPSRGWCCSPSSPCRRGGSRPAWPCSNGSACSA